MLRVMKRWKEEIPRGASEELMEVEELGLDDGLDDQFWLEERGSRRLLARLEEMTGQLHELGKLVESKS